MKTPKLEPGDLIEITWRDAKFANGWHTSQELVEFMRDDITLHTASYYAGEDKMYIYLVQTKHHDGNCMAPIGIPKGVIQLVTKRR